MRSCSGPRRWMSTRPSTSRPSSPPWSTGTSRWGAQGRVRADHVLFFGVERSVSWWAFPGLGSCGRGPFAHPPGAGLLLFYSTGWALPRWRLTESQDIWLIGPMAGHCWRQGTTIAHRKQGKTVAQGGLLRSWLVRALAHISSQGAHTPAHTQEALLAYSGPSSGWDWIAHACLRLTLHFQFVCTDDSVCPLPAYALSARIAIEAMCLCPRMLCLHVWLLRQCTFAHISFNCTHAYMWCGWQVLLWLSSM